MCKKVVKPGTKLALVSHAPAALMRRRTAASKEFFGDTPNPGKGRLPFAIPLLRRMEKHRTPVRNVRGDVTIKMGVDSSAPRSGA